MKRKAGTYRKLKKKKSDIGAACSSLSSSSSSSSSFINNFSHYLPHSLSQLLQFLHFSLTYNHTSKYSTTHYSNSQPHFTSIATSFLLLLLFRSMAPHSHSSAILLLLLFFYFSVSFAAPPSNEIAGGVRIWPLPVSVTHGGHHRLYVAKDFHLITQGSNFSDASRILEDGFSRLLDLVRVAHVVDANLSRFASSSLLHGIHIVVSSPSDEVSFC